MKGVLVLGVLLYTFLNLISPGPIFPAFQDLGACMETRVYTLLYICTYTVAGTVHIHKCPDY